MNIYVRYIALLLLCGTASAGLLSPPIFTPVTHEDGSMTWSLSIALNDIQKADRQLSSDELNRKLAGIFTAHHKVCPKGWEVTDSRTEKKRLIIDGRCL